MLLDKVFGLSHLSVHFMFPFQLMRYNRPFFRPVASNATLHWCCTRFKEISSLLIQSALSPLIGNAGIQGIIVAIAYRG